MSGLPPGMTQERIDREDLPHPPMDDERDTEPMDVWTCSDNCADKVPLGGYYLCRVCGAEWLPDEDT